MSNIATSLSKCSFQHRALSGGDLSEKISFCSKQISMPWDEYNYPASMKNLPVEVRNKAIEIANALLEESNMTEGIIIATAIKHARDWAKKRGYDFDSHGKFQED